jgi:TolB-like protein
MQPESSIDSSEIREELNRIISFPSFRSSKILTNFLKFIVTETLEGNEQMIKEYVIGTQVLKKNEDFDPKLDGIVRIHAHRLRKLLDEYYASRGADNPIRVFLPKGKYIPEFGSNIPDEKTSAKNDQSAEAISGVKPKIAVIPLTKFNKGEKIEVVCTSFCRDLGIELSKFNELNIISNYSVLAAQSKLDGMGELVSQLNPDFLVVATCIEELNEYRSIIELHSVRKNKLLWADTYLLGTVGSKQKVFDYQNVIQSVLSHICGFFGVIYQDLLSGQVKPQTYESLYAVYWHNQYHRHFSVKAYDETMRAIEEGLKVDPENSLLYSIKAQLLLDRRTMNVHFDVDPLNEGYDLALQSISLDQKNQHAWQILAWAFVMKHDAGKGTESLEKCLSINPNNNTYLGSLGFAYVCMGEYEKGLTLLKDAVRTPYYFWVANAGLSLY